VRSHIPRIATLLAFLVVAGTAFNAGPSLSLVAPRPTQPQDRPIGDNRPRTLLASHALIRFDACDAFLDYVTSHAVELVGPYGLNDPFYPMSFGGFPALDGTARLGEDTVPTTAAGRDYSGTNLQVLGVDEPDMVKTDGRRIVVLSEGALIVADVIGDEPEEIGRLQIADHSVQSLFLSGDTVLLFGSAWSPVTPLAESDARIAPYPGSPTLQLIEVDISAEPEIVRTMSIDGHFISARMIGDTIRLVLSSVPVGFEWSFPSGSGLQAERQALNENREIIEGSAPGNWIPYYVVTDSDGEVTAEGSLFDCDRATHPEEFSGLSMLSVVTIDAGEGLDVIDATGTLATGDTVYASSDNLYVATQSWQTWQWAMTGIPEDRPDDVITEIHKFDISHTDVTNYVASGRVTGYLLNQFSMDEHDGLLRVASTTSPNWWGSGFESEARVTVLGEAGGELVEIGMVDGLGEGEQIYSVRFIDDVGYVVTFRQIDPLYTIDLSDPEDPEVVGELKILGYSAYLHPLRNGLLMGVGQDATDTGQIRGTQISIFEVSDPANPRRVDQFTLGKESSSQVEYDHHAFLFWEPTGLAMVPVQQWWWDGKGESFFMGAVGLTVDGDGSLEEIRRLAHPGGDQMGGDYRAQIMRSIVIGDSVYTVSAKGIMTSDLGSLRERSWLGF